MNSNSTTWNVAKVVGVLLLIVVLQGIPIVGTAVFAVVVYVALRPLWRSQLNH
jgi:hypothetical protein